MFGEYTVRAEWNGNRLVLMKSQEELAKLLTAEGFRLISVNAEQPVYVSKRKSRSRVK